MVQIGGGGENQYQPPSSFALRRGSDIRSGQFGHTQGERKGLPIEGAVVMKKIVALTALATILLIAAISGHITLRSPRTAAPPRILYYVDPMHPSFRSDRPGTAPDCGMNLEPVYAGQVSAPVVNSPTSSLSLVALKQQMIGLRSELIETNRTTHVIRTTGRVTADENLVHKLTAGTDGWVQVLRNNPPGTLVKKGDILASYYSGEFRATETAYLGFVASIGRLKMGLDEVEQKRIDDSLRVYEEQLRSMGMAESQIKELNEQQQVTNHINLQSPADGIVLSRSLSADQRFEKGQELYKIADLGKVWIVADLHGDEVEQINSGDRVKISIPGRSKSFSALVNSDAALIDPASRTLKLRLEADNRELILRPDMFVDLEFAARSSRNLTVPIDAVVETGNHSIIYVQSRENTFEAREVKTGHSYGNQIEILAGLASGERIVTSGNFLLDSESRIHGNQPPHDTTSTVSPSEEIQDPVCGMSIDKAQAQKWTWEYKGKTYHFCSEGCLKSFRSNPSKYITESVASRNGAPNELVRP